MNMVQIRFEADTQYRVSMLNSISDHLYYNVINVYRTLHIYINIDDKIYKLRN